MGRFKKGQYGGMFYYDQPSFPSQAEWLVNKLTRPDTSKKAHLMLSFTFSTVFSIIEIICLNQVCYIQPVEEPQVLEAFTKIDP